ncbi:MAG TPA: penicillin-binding protein 2 [Myxococcota bacterium]|nr:penicillin-binding protein 2 [Myxococcota bacterium]
MPRTLDRGSDPVQPGRVRLAMVAVGLVFGLFAGRLFQLQLIEGDELRRQSERNSVRTMRLEAPRGEIVDRDGRVLATTRPAFGLEVVPDDLRNPERTFAALGQLLGEDPSGLEKALGKPSRATRFKPVRLADDLSPDQLARVEVHRYALAGVATEVEPRRHYLEGDLAAHLLGSLGEIRSDQLEKDEFDGYRSGDVIGQTGLEAVFERRLRGVAGGRNVVVDVAGREMDVLEEVKPRPGRRLVLALDLDLQRAAEQAMREVELPNDPRPTGAVVALDARTGDVLAMVSRPAYDPNDFAGRIDSATWKSLTTDEWVPLQNRAIQNQFPPGSTFKAFMAAAALHEGVINEHTTVFCPGSYWYGGRAYRCWKRGGHGTVTLHVALRSSCDVFFYTIGVKLGIERLSAFMTTLGLGHQTGVGLAHEAPGVMPSPEWKKRRFGERWYPGETVSVSIGQGYDLVTPVQLAVGYAALANGGRVLRPRLALRVEDAAGNEVESFPPEVLANLEISDRHMAAVMRGLEAVVSEPGGTGSRSRVAGVRVGGKTGTSQVVRLERTLGMAEADIPKRFRDHAWFAAVAPVEAPEISVAVLVEHGLHGSTAAAPVAQRVLQRYFEKTGRIAPPPPAEPAAPATPAEPAPATLENLQAAAGGARAVD